MTAPVLSLAADTPNLLAATTALRVEFSEPVAAGALLLGGALGAQATITLAADGLSATVSPATTWTDGPAQPLLIDAADAAGNVGSLSVTLDVDAIAPSFSFSSLSGLLADSAIDISVSEAIDPLSVMVGGTAFAMTAANVTVAGALITVLGSYSVGDGVTLEVRATDLAGNVGTASVVFDALAPFGLAQTEPALGATVGPNAALTLRFNRALAMAALSGELAAFASSGLIDDDTAVAVQLSGATDGAAQCLTLSATDHFARSIDVEVCFDVDAIAPSLVAVAPTAGSVLNALSTLSLEASEPLGVVSASGDFGALGPALVNGSVVSLGPLSHWTESAAGTLAVTLNDPYGNAATVEINYVIDATPPSVSLVSPQSGALIDAHAPLSLTASEAIDPSFVVGDGALFAEGALTLTVDAGTALTLAAVTPSRLGPGAGSSGVVRVRDLAGNEGALALVYDVLDRVVFAAPEPLGDDLQPGTWDAPKRSAQAALDVAAALYPAGPVRVQLGEGSYPSTATLSVATTVELVGGYDPTNWGLQPNNATRPTQLVDLRTSDTGTLSAVAVAPGLSGVALRHLHIEGGDVSDAACVGLTSASALTLEDLTVGARSCAGGVTGISVAPQTSGTVTLRRVLANVGDGATARALSLDLRCGVTLGGGGCVLLMDLSSFRARGATSGESHAAFIMGGAAVQVFESSFAGGQSDTDSFGLKVLQGRNFQLFGDVISGGCGRLSSTGLHTFTSANSGFNIDVRRSLIDGGGVGCDSAEVIGMNYLGPAMPGAGMPVGTIDSNAISGGVVGPSGVSTALRLGREDARVVGNTIAVGGGAGAGVARAIEVAADEIVLVNNLMMVQRDDVGGAAQRGVDMGARTAPVLLHNVFWGFETEEAPFATGPSVPVFAADTELRALEGPSGINGFAPGWEGNAVAPLGVGPGLVAAAGPDGLLGTLLQRDAQHALSANNDWRLQSAAAFAAQAGTNPGPYGGQRGIDNVLRGCLFAVGAWEGAEYNGVCP